VRARLLTLGVVLLFGAGCGSGDGSDSQENGPSIVDYCEYGSVSQAQLDGCIEHVTTEDIRRLSTHAALYAESGLDECLADAGPFCEGR
jgi:hypothetical protein